jgi:hypothetical protein
LGLHADEVLDRVDHGQVDSVEQQLAGQQRPVELALGEDFGRHDPKASATKFELIGPTDEPPLTAPRLSGPSTQAALRGSAGRLAAVHDSHTIFCWSKSGESICPQLRYTALNDAERNSLTWHSVIAAG